MSNSLVVVLEEAGAALHEQMQKQSQNPLQAVMENLTPVQRTAIRNALIGAMVGGAGGGGFAAAAKKPVGRPALAGALLGALAGGGGTYGLGLLTGQEKFPGETASPESLIGKGTEALVGLPMRHPLMTIGGIAGGIGAARTVPTAAGLQTVVREALKAKDPDAQAVLNRLWYIEKSKSLGRRVREAIPDPRKEVIRAIRERTGSPREMFGVKFPVSPHAKRLERALTGLIPKGPGRISRLLTALKPGTRVGRMLKAIPAGFKGMSGRGRAGLALLPAGLGLGYLLDKYIKGQY